MVARTMRRPRMMTLMVLSLMILKVAARIAWINEFHYSNQGSDAGEFVEIAVRGESFSVVDGYTLVLYNGDSGQVYDTHALRSTSSTAEATFTADGIILVVLEGFAIQNGSPDGMALVDDMGNLLEFTSYGGSFVATSGPAEGVFSTDMGAVESDSTLAGFSLQRTGSGCSDEAFSWASSAQTQTKGSVNMGQDFLCLSEEGGGSQGVAWISEFHYDNDGSDVDEFVEVACHCSDLAGYTVVLYNGDGGASYQTTTLSSGRSVGGVRLAVVNFSSIQNGSPDGLALVDLSGQVVEFLSYEGTFAATDGPASGMDSTDIGVQESTTTPVGYSLQRSGQGCNVGDFAWTAPLPGTRGAINSGQTFNCDGVMPSPLPPNLPPTGSPVLDSGMLLELSGSGMLSVAVISGETLFLGDIPIGIGDVYIEVDAIVDVDLQLSSSSDSLVNRSNGLVRDGNRAHLDWSTVRLEYSGFRGEQRSGTEGEEFLFIAGRLSSAVSVSLYAHGGSDSAVEIKYRWGYYEGAETKTGSDLKSALHAIIDSHTQLTYTPGCWEGLRRSDQDPVDPNNVIMLYSRQSVPKDNQYNPQVCSDCEDWWTREHVWAKSHGDFGTTRGPGTDIHALRASDKTVNTERSEKDFQEGGNGLVNGDARDDCPLCLQTSESFEPPDVVKGSVARMMFYMATRYNGGESSDFVTLQLVDGIGTPSGQATMGSGTFGDLATLLKWHAKYPPTDEEYYRNNVVFQIQGNRNPFIDYPEWADRAFDPSYVDDYTPTDENGDNNGSDNPDVTSAASCRWTLSGFCF